MASNTSSATERPDWLTWSNDFGMIVDIIHQSSRMNTETTPSPRRVQRIRHELRKRDVVVARTRRLGENFASITFACDALADFNSYSFDDHVKFFFEGPGGELVGRDYTPRHYDANTRELTL